MRSGSWIGWIKTLLAKNSHFVFTFTQFFLWLSLFQDNINHSLAYMISMIAAQSCKSFKTWDKENIWVKHVTYSFYNDKNELNQQIEKVAFNRFFFFSFSSKRHKIWLLYAYHWSKTCCLTTINRLEKTDSFIIRS